MLTRKLDSFLDSFFEGECSKALLLTGARQVGKTWAVRNLAKRKFKHYVEIIPIEVKSGKDYYVHSALDNVMDVQNYNLKQAIVLCNENLREEGRVLNIPIYMIMFFKKS